MHDASDATEPLEHNPATASRWDGLNTRIISGALAAALVLAALWAGGWLFAFFIIEAALVMRKEWNDLNREQEAVWNIIGLAYVGIPCASLLWLRNLRFSGHEHAGLAVVFYLLFVVWATDIGAYFAGRKLGGPKLAPAISPGKTWAGLAGGMLAAAMVGGLCHGFTPYPFTIGACALLGLILAVIAQVGDLFESWLKRRAGVKDSGALIPGHGGLLDRVDGLIFTVPFFALLVAFSGQAA